MTKKLTALIAVLAAALAFAACGGDDDSEDGSGNGGYSAAAGGKTTSSSSSKSTTEVGMKNLKFDPDKITVKVGQTVTWTNNESIPHDVKAQSGADFSSETFGEGKTYSFKTTKPGTIEYVCTLHPGMEGTITVK